jgi:hypothetical protein
MEHIWTKRMPGNDWTESWGVDAQLKVGRDDVAWWQSECVYIRSFPGYPMDSLQTGK